MKTTIRAKAGYHIRTVNGADTNQKRKVLYDDRQFIMIADEMTKEEMWNNLVNNEQFYLFEVFETVKGNKFAYCHDYITDIDYLVKLSDEVKK